MKSLLLSSICFVIALFSVTQAESCPIYYLGKFYVITEDGSPIPNATVWSFRTLHDSIEKEPGSLWKSLDDENPIVDTLAYEFWSGGWGRSKIHSGDDQSPKYAYRIQAEGFADLTLKSIVFKWNRTRNDEGSVLYIVLPKPKYKRTLQQLSRITSFHYNEVLEVTDTVHFNIASTKTYNDQMFAHGVIGKAEVTAYPNPFLSQITIDFLEMPLLPKTMKLYDVNGRKIHEQKLSGIRNELDLVWLKTGIYIVVVFDENNNLLLQSRVHKESF